MRRSDQARCETLKSHDLRLQLSNRVDHEVPISGDGGDLGEKARELLCEIAQAHEMRIYAGSINRDHVHMLLTPHLSVSRAVESGKSSQRLLSEYRPTDPAFSGNPKPPPLGGGVFTRWRIRAAGR
jgi:Transposase IS200 like